MIYTRENIKGFTLAEVMASIFIITVAVTILFDAFLLTYKNEINNEKDAQEEEYISQAFLIMDFALNNEQRSLLVSGNDIIITRITGRIDKVTAYNNNLIIKYDDGNYNYILKGIDHFYPEKKGKLIYINIGYKGKDYIRCKEEKDLF